MARSIWAFINRVIRSHFGHVLLAVSWTFILLVFVHAHLYFPQLVDCMPTQDEGPPPEILIFYPIWVGVIWTAHIPSMLCTWAVTKLLQIIFSLSCGPTAKVEMPLLFAFSAI